MSHEIHTSERRGFRGCRRRWNWVYREGYVPDTPIRPLEFGIAYHSGMEAFYDPDLWSTTSAEEKLERAQDKFGIACAAQAKNYLKLNGIRELPEDAQEDYDSRIELGMGMLDYHARYVHPKFDGWFKPVAVEIPFQVPIPHPDYPNLSLSCSNSPYCGQEHDNTGVDSQVMYAGRVDALVEDLRYGGYFIFDWKTASSLAKDDDFLQLDDQVGSYAWALRHVLNLDVRGFVYAEIRKDYPQPPKLLKRTSGGRSFSVAADQATSIEIFEPYVKKHDPFAYENGAYDAYIKYLKSNEATQYHQRFVVIKSRTELENIGKNISLEVADMIDAKLRIYPSVGRYSCSTCAFRQPCLGLFMGEDVSYQLETSYKKTGHRYWMETSQTTEKASK